MRDRVGMNFQDDGKANAGCELRGFVGTAGDLRDGGGDFIERENLFRFHLCEQSAPLSQSGIEDALGFARALSGEARIVRDGRRFVEASKVIAVAPHVNEGARRSIWIGKCRNSGCIQDGFAGFNILSAHPASQQAAFRTLWRKVLDARATPAGSVIPCGARMASRPSLSGSFIAISIARAYRSGSASPKTSIGFP